MRAGALGSPKPGIARLTSTRVSISRAATPTDSTR